MIKNGIMWQYNFQQIIFPLVKTNAHPVIFIRRLCSSFSFKGRKVIVSRSQDIFTNLALEEWIYENEDLKNQSVLLMWRNRPTVVIGRHQNPWLECDVTRCVSDQVNVARRKSGGGAVYHDLGNLNLSFLMDRKSYDRRKNLELIISAITGKWDVDLQVNKRDDILLEGFYKISGTASKLGRDKTYHHFTLLCDVNKDNIMRYLDSPHATVGVHSRATQSLKARVKNLKESIPDMSYEDLVQVIGEYYLNVNNHKGSIHLEDPTDERLFPGLECFQYDLEDWEWTYGKTPKFSLTRNFASDFHGHHLDVKIKADIDKGRIKDLNVEINGTVDEDLGKLISNVEDQIEGQRFWLDDLKTVFNNLHLHLNDSNENSSLNSEKLKWITNCLKETLYLKEE